MWWFQQGLSFLPALLAVWTAAAFVLAYVTAVVLRHVDPLVPYISDTGTMAPERCVFGIMLDVSAFLGMATVYVRYKQVEALTGADDADGGRSVSRLNRLGLLLGLFSSMGMCVVANFQVSSSQVKAKTLCVSNESVIRMPRRRRIRAFACAQKTTLFRVHLLGAVLTLGVGAVYILAQTLLSHRMQPRVHSRRVFHVRLALALWTLASIVGMFVSSVVMYSSLPGVDVARKLHWTPGETGYTAHIVSTLCEWSLAFSFISFFLTFIRDFQKIKLRAEADVQCRHLYDRPPRSLAAAAAASESSPLLPGDT
ncbi:DNA damage-regulated autophagy modulator protein 2b isoform X1 [Phyllopteryx taeniolatus]|uniref:DNA damage-regulated autophagy modulator protein 2b isoform X1 n=1 Tax=Phyllopteryx taeniolatus TaxID=161469 RepID=UPI002AD38A32|nr:DNA damage-regulated autophagy modulator protein 2b isoform X1 [Phyllopteryx taeniolatus]